MGMYTELDYSAELKQEIPEKLIPWLRKWIQGERPLEPFEPHPFFETWRWRALPLSQSAYFTSPARSVLAEDEIFGTRICIRANIKNYDGEIKLFAEWISKYIVETDSFLGYKRYEEENFPTLLFYPHEWKQSNHHLRYQKEGSKG